MPSTAAGGQAGLPASALASGGTLGVVTGESASVGVPDPPRYGEELVEELEDLQQGEGDSHAARFLDREASWLDFNSRVLELAADPDLPLLERVRFCAIFAVNLDEFFMVRVAGLRRRIATGIAVFPPGSLTAKEQLDLIARRAHELASRNAALFRDVLTPALRDRGICLVRYTELSAAERDTVDRMFAERVYPVLTPLAVDPAHPFPYISGLSLNLAVMVRDRETGQDHFARVKVPPLLPRFVPVGDLRFVPLEEVMAAHLPELFPGLQVLETHAFRVTRNEDLDVEEEEVENLLQALERELMRRRFGPPVRLEVEDSMSERVLSLLLRELGIGSNEVYRVPGPLDLGALWPISELDCPQLRYESFLPVAHSYTRGSEEAHPDLFVALQSGDLLAHHPYDSFATSVQAFIEQAAADPAVLAIKQTLYRTSGDSPIVDALIDAAEAGKQVLVVVEIKARFDEQANIRWARALEQAGCHVVYGVVGLKTHAKMCLVIRQEADGSLMRYAHLGTGNYNPKTARSYEDVGILTANQAVGADVADLFNHLSGYTKQRDYRTLLVAPETLRAGVLQLIQHETEVAQSGRPAAITMKLNSLVDERVIDALYEASGARVRVDLIVRGMCSLRPKVPGLSESIRVRSILGRFLEHSRIFRFANAGTPDIWIGSADMMHRNLDRRVEVLVGVHDRAVRDQLSYVLDAALEPTISRWELEGDGSWTRYNRGPDGRRLIDYQELLIHRRADRAGELPGGGGAGAGPAKFSQLGERVPPGKDHPLSQRPGAYQ